VDPTITIVVSLIPRSVPITWIPSSVPEMKTGEHVLKLGAIAMLSSGELCSMRSWRFLSSEFCSLCLMWNTVRALPCQALKLLQHFYINSYCTVQTLQCMTQLKAGSQIDTFITTADIMQNYQFKTVLIVMSYTVLLAFWSSLIAPILKKNREILYCLSYKKNLNSMV
jgi:hypothetical protein